VVEENKTLGKIKDVLSAPGNDVYVIETSEGKELLIPALKDSLKNLTRLKKL
jgi:16S rRNA processing protein RimM